MKSNASKDSRENKKTRQIVWVENKGYYKKQNLFFVVLTANMFRLYFLANGREVIVTDYSTFKDAKRGAERFLKRLQEVVK